MKGYLDATIRNKIEKIERKGHEEMNEYKMLKYYTVPWSLYCQKGEELLKKAGIAFTKIELTDREIFAAVPRDLGFHRLPVLIGKGVFCEGLEQIKRFISKCNTS